MEDFAKLKKISCPPIYLLGGSGCIVSNYISRATVDIDVLDMNYPAAVGRLFNLIEPVDILDLSYTTISEGFENRSVKLNGFCYLNIYVLSKEDIITTYDSENFQEASNLVYEIDKNKDMFHYFNTFSWELIGCGFKAIKNDRFSKEVIGDQI